MDEEILQDFIVEAGEIIENLNEQLVQIEKTPDDKDLLNAIFRGFHTVKGGAGFLQLTSLVEVCHAAESLFDELRNGRISMSPDLMDAVLQAYDEITTMFDSVKNGDVPDDAPSELIDRLHALAQGSASAAPAQETPKEEPKPEPKEEPKVEPVAEETAEAQDDSAIILASALGHLDIVKYLVINGANIFAQDQCAIYAASQYKQYHIIDFIESIGLIYLNNY